jgi:hypothetical protein
MLIFGHSLLLIWGKPMPTCPNCGEKGYFLLVFSTCDFCHKIKCVKCGENIVTHVRTAAKIDDTLNEFLLKNKILEYSSVKHKGAFALCFCTVSCFNKFVEQLFMVPHCEISDEANQYAEHHVKFSYPDFNSWISFLALSSDTVENIKQLQKDAKIRALHNEEIRKAISDIETRIEEGDNLHSAENFEKAAASFEDGIRLCNKVKELANEGKFEYNVTKLKNTLIEKSKESQRKLKEEKQNRVMIDQRTTHIEYKTEIINHKGDNVNVGKIGDDVNIENSVIQRSNIGGKQGPPISICPYCSKELDFLKTPKFCPFCREQILKN